MRYFAERLLRQQSFEKFKYALCLSEHNEIQLIRIRVKKHENKPFDNDFFNRSNSGKSPEIEIPSHAFERLDIKQGQTIRVSLKKSAIHIIKD